MKDKIRTELFAAEYVRNGGNGTKAYQAISPHVDDNVAHMSASRLIRKDTVKKTILDMLPSDIKDKRVLDDAYKAARPNEIGWKDLHKFFETSLKLKGYLADKPPNTMNVALVIRK